MEEQKNLYKNETKFTKENLQTFSKFIWLKYNKFRYLEIIIFSCLFFVSGIIGAISQSVKYHKIPNTFTLIFVLIFAVVIIKMIKLAKGNVKINSQANDITYKYEFTENYLLISTELASQKFLYTDLSNIKNICNTEKYIYIMINNRQGFIVDKRGFENYNDQDFTNYLKDKFNDKYINFLDKTKKKLYSIKDIIFCVILFMMFCTIVLSFLD